MTFPRALDLFNGATNGQSFERRIFFVWIYLAVRPRDTVLVLEEEVFFAVRPTDRVLEEEVVFGSTLQSLTNWAISAWHNVLPCIYLAVRPTDTVLEEEVFFAFI